MSWIDIDFILAASARTTLVTLSLSRMKRGVGQATTPLSWGLVLGIMNWSVSSSLMTVRRYAGIRRVAKKKTHGVGLSLERMEEGSRLVSLVRFPLVVTFPPRLGATTFSMLMVAILTTPRKT